MTNPPAHHRSHINYVTATKRISNVFATNYARCCLSVSNAWNVLVIWYVICVLLRHLLDGLITLHIMWLVGVVSPYDRMDDSQLHMRHIVNEISLIAKMSASTSENRYTILEYASCICHTIESINTQTMDAMVHAQPDTQTTSATSYWNGGWIVLMAIIRGAAVVRRFNTSNNTSYASFLSGRMYAIYTHTSV